MKKIILFLIPLAMVFTVIPTVFAGGGKEKMDSDDYDKGKKSEKMTKANVIEIASFDLNPGVTPEDFNKLDKRVEKEHVVKQPGFVARETGVTEDGKWVAIIYWTSLEAADASMASFADAPATADFMANMDPSTMQMQRYRIQRDDHDKGKKSEKMMKEKANVIEIASFDLNPGVTPEDFNKLDKRVEKEHVVKQPGFVARETGVTEDGKWVAIIYWTSLEAADASMASFADAPATADFMANMDPSTMQMHRYMIQR